MGNSSRASLIFPCLISYIVRNRTPKFPARGKLYEWHRGQGSKAREISYKWICLIFYIIQSRTTKFPTRGKLHEWHRGQDSKAAKFLTSEYVQFFTLYKVERQSFQPVVNYIHSILDCFCWQLNNRDFSYRQRVDSKAVKDSPPGVPADKVFLPNRGREGGVSWEKWQWCWCWV